MTTLARRVLVAGATGEIGRAVSRQLVERGDRVVLVARDEMKLDAQRSALDGGAGVSVVAADLAASGGPAAVARRSLETGPVDDLVWCAGPFRREPLESVSRASMEELFLIHAIAPVLLTRELKASLATSGGAVVALSDAGVDRPFPNHAAYLAAKGAMDAAMRAIATELAPAVRVNVLRVGVVTDPSCHDPSRAQRLAARSLSGRMGTPAEVARVVVSLLRTGWIAGQAWTVG